MGRRGRAKGVGVDFLVPLRRLSPPPVGVPPVPTSERTRDRLLKICSIFLSYEEPTIRTKTKTSSLESLMAARGARARGEGETPRKTEYARQQGVPKRINYLKSALYVNFNVGGARLCTISCSEKKYTPRGSPRRGGGCDGMMRRRPPHSPLLRPRRSPRVVACSDRSPRIYAPAAPWPTSPSPPAPSPPRSCSPP